MNYNIAYIINIFQITAIGNNHSSIISNLSKLTFSTNCSFVKKVLLKYANSFVFFSSHIGTGIPNSLHKSIKHFSSLSLNCRVKSSSTTKESLRILVSLIILPYNFNPYILSIWVWINTGLAKYHFSEVSFEK